MKVYLSYGMGVESTAILLNWINNPETCPCALADLTVITAQVGNEYADTGRDVEEFILPVLRKHAIRTVQVARAGHDQASGIIVLDDSRNPTRCFVEGAYKLSDEMIISGTVPQFGGVHRCALKFKAWVIEEWLKKDASGEIKHAFGYNSEETKRIEKSEYAFAERDQADAEDVIGPETIEVDFGFNADEAGRVERVSEYDGFVRSAIYPLLEWGWNREDCIAYIYSVIGVIWKKSCCVFCPFASLKKEGLIDRQIAHAEQVSQAILMEYVSLAMNPRSTVYRSASLAKIVADSGNTEAVDRFSQILASEKWALYRVRRIYTAKGKASRCVEKLDVFDSQSQALTELSTGRYGAVEVLNDHAYVYVEKRAQDIYPAREEFFTVSPARVETKAPYGVPKFDARWSGIDVNDDPAQVLMFVNIPAVSESSCRN